MYRRVESQAPDPVAMAIKAQAVETPMDGITLCFRWKREPHPAMTRTLVWTGNL